MTIRYIVGAGLCGHCGRPDAPVNRDGFIDRHRRLDWRPTGQPERANELCANHNWRLKPGQVCRHPTREACGLTATNRNCHTFARPFTPVRWSDGG